MNEQTINLLNGLAAKLGTTVEYLWGALLAQAKIEMITDLLYLVLVIVVGIILWAWYRSCNKKWGEEKDRYSEWGNHELAAGILIIAAAADFFCLLACLVNLPMLFAEAFNPQYYALHKVLSLISKQ